MPNLQLEAIATCRFLLLGAGTLGCNVARCLLVGVVRRLAEGFCIETLYSVIWNYATLLYTTPFYATLNYINHTTPHHTTPHHTTPHHTTLHSTTQHHTTPHHTTPHYTKPHYTTPHHNTPHHTTPHHNTPHHTTPHHNTPHHTTPHCSRIIPFHTTLKQPHYKKKTTPTNHTTGLGCTQHHPSGQRQGFLLKPSATISLLPQRLPQWRSCQSHSCR